MALYFILPFLMATLGIAVAACAQRAPARSIHSSRSGASVALETVPLELHLDGVEPVIVEARRIGTRALLPIRGVLAWMGVPYMERGDSGALLLGRQRSTFRLSNVGAIVSDTLYVTTERIATLLHATVFVDWRELTVTIRDDTLLPASRRRVRALRRQRRRDHLSISDDWEVDESVFRKSPGGVDIVYGTALANQAYERRSFATIEAPLGKGTIAARFHPSAGRPDFVWFAESNRHAWRRHLIVGDLPAFDRWAHQLTGMTISNAPSAYAETYDTISIASVAPAGWEIDVERGEELLASDSSATSGRYAFRVPVSYGTARYVVTMYGPEEQRIQKAITVTTPYALVPPHRMYYAVSVGRCRDARCTQAVDGQLRFAPVSRVTFVSAASSERGATNLRPGDTLAMSSRGQSSLLRARSDVVVQLTNTASVSASTGFDGTHALTFQYVPSLSSSFQIVCRDSLFTYGAHWVGRMWAIRPSINVAGRTRIHTPDDEVQVASAFQWRLGRFETTVRRRRGVLAVDAGDSQRWIGGGELWIPLVSANFLRVRIDDIGARSGPVREASLSVALPRLSRLDIRGQWRSGDAHPAITWSFGKTLSFASVRSTGLSASNAATRTMQTIEGAMHIDPSTHEMTVSPYTHMTEVPLVTTLR